MPLKRLSVALTMFTVAMLGLLRTVMLPAPDEIADETVSVDATGGREASPVIKGCPRKLTLPLEPLN